MLLAILFLVGRIVRKYCVRKDKKGGGQKYVNVIVSEVGGSGYEFEILLAYQSTDWWLNTRANIHIYSDINLFSFYQATDS
jgi:hypothetical protein